MGPLGRAYRRLDFQWNLVLGCPALQEGIMEGLRDQNECWYHIQQRQNHGSRLLREQEKNALPRPAVGPIFGRTRLGRTAIVNNSCLSSHGSVIHTLKIYNSIPATATLLELCPCCITVSIRQLGECRFPTSRTNKGAISSNPYIQPEVSEFEECFLRGISKMH